MAGPHLRHWMIPIFFATVVAKGCIRKNTAKMDSPSPSTLSATPLPRADVFPQSFGLSGITPLTERSALGLKLTEASLNDVLVSLAFCDCLPRLQSKLITSLNNQRGALPQALTPAVRREILSNPQLKILNIVPRPIDDFVGGLFADEKTVAEEIGKGLRDKIKPAEPGWAESSDVPILQLDGFPPLPGTTSPTSGRTVRMVDVWSRWALIYSQGGPWSSTRGTDKNAGLLWHELLRSLAEGEYLFGLATSNDGESWGGLTLPVDLQINNPGPFDPRTKYSQVRFLTGQLDLSLSSNNSLSLARYGGDRWTWREDSVPLAEQALQWWVAARMLHRLRPLNRGPMTTYFPAIIPDDSYQLSLIVLPALDALLSGRFIDEGSRAIRSYIRGAQVGGLAQSIRERADPQTLSLLIMALSEWSKELTSVSDLNVSADTAQQLKSAPLSLLRGAQLIVQTVLGETLAARPTNTNTTTETPVSLFVDPKNPQQGELSLRDHAQLMYALTRAERNLMPSPYLRGRLMQLAQGFSDRWQAEPGEIRGQQPLTLLLWAKIALETFVGSYPDARSSALFKEVLTELNQRLQNFEESALQ